MGEDFVRWKRVIVSVNGRRLVLHGREYDYGDFKAFELEYVEEVGGDAS